MDNSPRRSSQSRRVHRCASSEEEEISIVSFVVSRWLSALALCAACISCCAVGVIVFGPLLIADCYAAQRLGLLPLISTSKEERIDYRLAGTRTAYNIPQAACTAEMPSLSEVRITARFVGHGLTVRTLYNTSTLPTRDRWKEFRRAADP